MLTLRVEIPFFARSCEQRCGEGVNSSRCVAVSEARLDEAQAGIVAGTLLNPTRSQARMIGEAVTKLKVLARMEQLYSGERVEVNRDGGESTRNR